MKYKNIHQWCWVFKTLPVFVDTYHESLIIYGLTNDYSLTVAPEIYFYDEPSFNL